MKTFSLAGVILLSFMGSLRLVAQPEPFTLNVQPSTHAEAHVYGSASHIEDDPSQSDSSTIGTEASSCGAGEERRSNGSASASVNVAGSTSGQKSVTLKATAYANGGHFVRCSACQFGVCIGRNGEDTAGLSQASSQAVVEIRFGQDSRPIDYTLDIGSSLDTSGASFSLRLEDPEGKVLLTSSSSGGTFTIRSQPGKAYRLSALMQARAEDRGGCCSARQSGNASLSVALSRAPILATAQEGERIVGGRETQGFPTVGAILVEGNMHCTGTLVGARTVLTAAHCLYGFDTSKMSFVLGHNVDDPVELFGVTGGAYPKGEDGLSYDDASLRDDIAVLYLDRSAKSASTLHRSVPTLDSLVAGKRRLTFVGFGYDVVEGEKTGLGIKRVVEMPISVAENRTFRYAFPKKNTCNGDSGGPAFVGSGNKLVITGVTSWGDSPCLDFGVDTRVDAYLKWLDERIR